MQVLDPRYGISTMEVKSSGSSEWLLMTNDGSNVYTLEAPGLPFQLPLSMRVTDLHGQTVECPDAVVTITPGEIQTTDQQFPLCADDATLSGPVWAEPGGPTFLGVHPTPSRGVTALTVVLPEASTATVGIYDVTGRRVVVLTERALLPAGRSVLTWDGRGSDGAPVEPGAYFARVRADGVDTHRRITMIR